MTQQVIGIGTNPNDGTGDPLRTAFTKTNANFTDLYNNCLQWYHVGNALSYTTFSTAANTNTLTLFSLPAGAIIHAVKIKHSTPFGGGSIATYTISVGSVAQGTAGYASAFNVFQSTGSRVYQLSSNLAGEDTTSSTAIQVTATSTGANLNAATAGVVDIWVMYSTGAI